MSTTKLLLSVLFSSIGMGYFIYGKKQRRVAIVTSGLLLFVIPYLMPNIYLLIMAGIVLIAIPLFVDF